MNSLFETGGAGPVATTHDWLTPPELLAALGAFDLDPCASQFQPWKTAKTQLTIADDGLAREWAGRVWCNPPYGDKAAEWLARCGAHGNAIALIFARTETAAFQAHVFGAATALLFIRGRLRFRLPGGGHATANAGAPSVLVAYGTENAECLARCGIEGALVWLKK